jgi:energy-coupling factor transporter ATP-binding protein EcfA2
MADYKVQSEADNADFVYTRSFRKIYNMFRSLKNRKGRFVLIIGSPGTGKSANIYSALKILDLNVYDPTLFLDHHDMSSSEVFDEFYQTLRKDLGVRTNEEVYQKVQEYDVVLLADKILDSEFIDKDKVGLSLWSLNKGFDTFPFYFGILMEYFKHRKDLNKINVVIQTAFVFRFKGVKYDLLTDFYVISPVLVFILNRFFEVMRISYSQEETIKIVKKNFKKVDDDQIKLYIDEYGCKPRFIFERLEKEGKKKE